jgi:uncharacterized protein DUF4352
MNVLQSRPRTGSRRRRSFLALIVAAPVFLLILACGESSVNTGSNVGSSGGAATASSTKPASPQHFKVGDNVKVGDTYQVTVNSVKTHAGDEFTKPKDGSTFLIVDVTVKNLSSKEQSLSSVLQFNLKDSTGQKYDETFLGDNKPIDGKVEPGGLLRGQFTYEVPTAQHAFTYSFEADPFTGGQTIWDVSR